MFLPVILAGGKGTRLWPLSREAYPKQLISLTDKHTLLQETVIRAQILCPSIPPIIICNTNHRFLVAAQLQTLGIKTAPVILEPMGKNTAPAVALAALRASQEGADPILLVMPADHVIKNQDNFKEIIEKAKLPAEQGKLITFGIKPTCPEIGYGYIKRGTVITAEVFNIAEFVEKPELSMAQRYLESGEYFWNSGIFMFRASRYLQLLKQHAPAIFETCQQAYLQATIDLDFIRITAESFENCPADSIDYAIMEKTDQGVILSLDSSWSDLGSWDAVHTTVDSDEAGNHLRGEVHAEDITNCYVRSEHRLVAAVGIRDQVIVETADAILVVHKDHCQKIKPLVERLKKNGHTTPFSHKKVHRPWGSYEALDQGERFHVKRIIVNPGSKLSLQLHHHRSEHWIVVRGTAKITRGEEISFLNENESTFIPQTVPHRLENPGKIPLELIEVQSGAYLAEDDIVRLQDDYGRVSIS
ncbi:MAG: mannose-1-phosphate guanylyltransferase/mannose-6-phosphate isomerase [Gammaproteobacteria bacterium]